MTEDLGLAPVSQGGDETLIVTFYEKAVQNIPRSNEDGVARYDNKVYVRIIIPGQKNNIYEQPAKDEHKRRFPRQWRAFQEGKEQLPEGTPIEAWPLLTPAQVMEFKSLNILTVEQFANLGDDGLSRVGMGARELQQKARAFLSGSTVKTQALQAQLEDLTAKLSAALAEIAELKAKKPGRKPRVVEAAE